MVKIKAIRLKNFCGYRDNQFIFATKKGINDFSILCGPNGTGKSSVLDAIRILASPKELAGRDIRSAMKRYIYSEDYDPAYYDIQVNQGLIKPEEMELEGIFETEDGQDKRVLIEITNKKAGVIVNELSTITKGTGKDRGKNENTFCYYIDADNPMNMNKFTLPRDYSSKFLEMAEAIYKFPCSLACPVSEEDEEESVDLYDDLIIQKKRGGDNIKVHFKRMSAGEKKIATLLRYLYNPTYIDNLNIILIDNIDLHTYHLRHKPMINKMLEHFPDKQFVTTCHSETMINYIKEIRGDSHIFDVEKAHEGVKVL